MKTDNQYMICFLDILGYGNLIDKCHTDVNLIIEIENIFRESLNKFEGFQKRKETDDVTKAIKTVYKSISFRVISDSTLITMPLFNLPLINDDFTDKETILLYVESFLNAISMYILYISGKLGFYFRGGITIGQYYENQLNRPENTFVFSKALDEAVKIEKKANYPRIIIEQNSYDNIFNLIKENNYDNFLEKYFIDDCDGKYYLHIYNLLYNDNFPHRESVLNNIKEGIMCQKNNLDSTIFNDKYKWLIKYHNKYIPPDLISYKI